MLLADEMEEVAVKGLHRIEVRDGDGDPGEAVLEIRYARSASYHRSENRNAIPR
jgi:hypothetical protein